LATMFDPRARSGSRTRSWKLTATGIAVLLVAGGGALGYAVWNGAHHANASDATGSGATSTTGVPTIRVGTVSGAAAAPVETAVALTGAAGIGSASFTLTYDPTVVAVTGVRNGNIAEGQLTWRQDATAGTIVMLVTTALPKGVSGDSAIAYVTLKAIDGAVGKISPLAVAMRSAALSDGQSVAVTTSSGSFHNGVPGDVNGDGKVDKDDYERLASYLVGDNVPIVQLNADLNGDGRVTDADAILLHQQLAVAEGAK